MATSKVGIFNLALSHLAHSKEVASEDEASAAAAACRRFYDQVVEEVLRDFAWPFATKIAALGLVEEDPNDEWGYSYQGPSDCLTFRRILSGTRNDSRQSRVPYRIAYGSSGWVIYTDAEDAQGEYTVRVEDPGRFTPDFVQAVATKLAGYIAPRVTNGDPSGLGKRALQLYEYQIGKAQDNAANEEQLEEQPEAETIRARS